MSSEWTSHPVSLAKKILFDMTIDLCLRWQVISNHTNKSDYLNKIPYREGDGVATKFALGHGAINLMVTGLTLYADVADHPFSPPALGPQIFTSGT